MGVRRGLSPPTPTPGPCQYLVGLRGRSACLRCPGPHQVTSGAAGVCPSVTQRRLKPLRAPELPSAPPGFAPLRQGKGAKGTWRRRGRSGGLGGGGAAGGDEGYLKCDWCIVGLQRLWNECMNLWGGTQGPGDGPVARGGASALRGGREEPPHVFVC